MIKYFILFLITLLTAAAEKPPNIIIIYCDDMGYADIGPFGAKGYETPHLDKMAAEGMKFTDFYVGRTFCTPSRASLLTGCYPQRVGIHGNFNPKSKNGLNPEEMTIAEVLKQKNYATAAFGKWHLGHLEKYLPMSQGFDEFYGIPYSNDMWPYHPENKKYKFPDLPLIEGNKIINPAMKPKDQVNLTVDLTKKTVDFIKRKKDYPFFIYLAHPQPHVPLFVSDKFKGKTELGLYGDVIAEIDWSVGQVMNALKENGVADNTLVIFSSDNGPWLRYGDHGGSAGELREGKGTQFEGGGRVPCIMHWPAKIPAGKVNKNMCSTIDLLPTICKITGAELPKKKIDGKDITALLSDEKAASPHKAFFFCPGPIGVRSGKWKLLLAHNSKTIPNPGKGGLPGPQQKMKVELSLFDLEKDVSEKENLADKYPEVVQRLKGYISEFQKDLKADKRK